LNNIDFINQLKNILEENGYAISFKKHKEDLFTINANKNNYSYGDCGRSEQECLVKMLHWVSGFTDGN